jgi:hypothetical protein
MKIKPAKPFETGKFYTVIEGRFKGLTALASSICSATGRRAQMHFCSQRLANSTVSSALATKRVERQP